jgi:hypothetical protein
MATPPREGYPWLMDQKAAPQAGLRHHDPRRRMPGGGVFIADLERDQLKLLRSELGLDPPPGNNRTQNPPQAGHRMINSHCFTSGRYGVDRAARRPLVHMRVH